MEVQKQQAKGKPTMYLYGDTVIAVGCTDCNESGNQPPKAGEECRTYADSGKGCQTCKGLGIFVTQQGKEQIDENVHKDQELNHWCVSKGVQF